MLSRRVVVCGPVDGGLFGLVGGGAGGWVAGNRPRSWIVGGCGKKTAISAGQSSVITGQIMIAAI